MPADRAMGLSLLRTHSSVCDYHKYSLCLSTEEWPGWVGLGGWLNTETVYS